MDKNPDVAIIGGGPAGGSAARTLAANGLRVLIIEMRQRVGYPVQCGEALSRTALEENSLREGDWIVSRVEGLAVHPPEGETAYVHVPGYCIDRAAFDSALVEEARAFGAKLATRCRAGCVLQEDGGYSVSTSQGTVRAEYVVAADGPRSQTALALGLTQRGEYHLGLQYKFPSTFMPDRPEWLHLYLSGAYRGGYAWTFPRSHEVSVGVDVPTQARSLLTSFCHERGLDERRRLGTNGGLIPTKVQLRKLGVGNILVVGDAAGATNPIFGGGIHPALSTGRLAAESILQAHGGRGVAAGPLYHRKAMASPFFHPVLSRIAERLHSVGNDEFRLAVELFRKRRSAIGLAKMVPGLFREPALFSRLMDIPALREALRLTVSYGW